MRISLPEGVRGSAAASSTRFGTLNPASDSAQWRRRSSGVTWEPLSSTITAVTAYKLSGDLRTLYGPVLGPVARGLYLRASA